MFHHNNFKKIANKDLFDYLFLKKFRGYSVLPQMSQVITIRKGRKLELLTEFKVLRCSLL